MDSLKQLLVSDPNNTEWLNKIAWNYTNSYQDSSLFYSDKAIRLAISTKDSASLAYSYYIKGVALERQGDFTLSEAAFRTSLFFSEQASLVKRKAYTLNSLGILYDQLGKLDSAFYFYEKCLDELRKFENNGADASVLFNLGMLYESMGNYAQALSKYFESMEIREKMEDRRRLAMCQAAIALIYKEQKKYPLAYQYFRQALHSLDNEKHTFQLEILYSNITNFFLETNDLDSAEFYLNKINKIITDLNDEEGMAFATSLESKLESKRGNLEKALALCRKAIHYYSSTGYQLMEFELSLNQVEILVLLQRHVEAKNLAESLFRFESLRSKELQRDLHWQLARIHEYMKNYPEALRFERIYRTYQDSIYNVGLAGELADLRTKYEAEKSARSFDKLSSEKKIQKEILQRTEVHRTWLIIILSILFPVALIIWKLYTDRKKAAIQLTEKNNIIEEALLERELLLKEIHHRVKNNLQVVSSLLSIQLNSNFSASDIVETSQDRIRAMAMIHEKLYQTQSLTGLNAKEYIENLVDQYRISHAQSICNATFITKLNAIIFSLDKLIPLGLIINECITNTFKYAFSGNSGNEINIKLQEKSDDAILTIFDNGIGFDASEVESSLGLRLIQGFTNQLNGELLFTGKHGTKYEIVFPIL